MVTSFGMYECRVVSARPRMGRVLRIQGERRVSIDAPSVVPANQEGGSGG